MVKVATALSTRIKELRESEGLTQQAFAKEFKISKQTVSNYENNERTPDVTLMLAISSHFNVSMDYLTGNSEYRTPGYEHMLNVEMPLTESIINMPDTEKLFLRKLLVENSENFSDFLKGLMLYRDSGAASNLIYNLETNENPETARLRAEAFKKVYFEIYLEKPLTSLILNIYKRHTGNLETK